MSKKEKTRQPKKISHPMSLHKKMVLFVSLTIFIITSCFGVFAYFSAKKHIEAKVEELHKNNTKHIITLVEEKIHNYTSSLEAISKLNIITNPEVGWNNKASILLHEKEKLDYVNIGIADSHGNLTLLNGEVINISNNEYYQKSIKGNTFISRPFTKLEEETTELVAIATPLIHNDETVGILVGFQDSNKFRENIQNIGLNHGKEIHLINRDEDINESTPLKYDNWNIHIRSEEVSVGSLRSFGLKLSGLIIIFSIIGFIVSLYIISWNTEPLINMINTMTSVANLDFSKNINRKYLRRKDQIGQLAQNCQDILSNLRTFVSKILKSSNRIANSANELAFVSNLTAVSTTSFAQSAAGIFDNRKTEMETMLGCLFTIKDISSKMNNISEHSMEINRLSQEVYKKAYSSEQEFNEYKRLIENMDFHIKHGNEICTKLERNSKKMENLMKTIENTIDKINSISLNAAIEASKVENGDTGFTVIAEELDKLSDETDISTKNLYNLIKENKKLINNVYELIKHQQQFIHNSKERIKSTKDISNEVTSLIDSISAEIHNMTIDISYITEETLDIVDSAANIEDIQKETAYKEEDVSAITSEQTVSIEEIYTASKDLARSADNLQKLIACIKV